MSRPRILVVEDEKVVAADIQESLLRLGYEVVGTAAYGAEALKLGVRNAPDLVLMDIKLKGAVDGIDAAQEIGYRLGIPVVYLTAHADAEILERAKKTSPSGYVLKPFDDRALRSAVDIALYRHHAEQELVESERRLAAAIASIDEAVILANDRCAVTFLNQAAERLTGRNKEEALGKPVGDIFTLIHAETGLVLRCPVARVAVEGSAVSLGEESLLVDKRGANRAVRGNAVPLRDPEGELAGVALICRAA